MFRRSTRQAALAGAVAYARWRWPPPRKPKTFSPRCSARSAGRMPLRSSGCRLPAKAVPSLRKAMSTGPRIITYGGSQAFCVRSCDGRYFPVNGPDNQSRAASCNSFCPASETRVVYGSNIDNAATEKREAVFGIAECISLSQRDRGGMHLQRQGPDRSCAGQDRERPDASQGRSCRRRQWADGRRPQRRQTRRIAGFLARPEIGALTLSAGTGGGERSDRAAAKLPAAITASNELNSLLGCFRGFFGCL